jgi:hypothetical protein
MARALAGIVQRESNLSNVIVVRKSEIDSDKDANRLICKGTHSHTPDRHQMHAINGWFGVEAKRWGCTAIVNVNVHKSRRFGDHIFINSPCLL